MQVRSLSLSLQRLLGSSSFKRWRAQLLDQVSLPFLLRFSYILSFSSLFLGIRDRILLNLPLFCPRDNGRNYCQAHTFAMHVRFFFSIFSLNRLIFRWNRIFGLVSDHPLSKPVRNFQHRNIWNWISMLALFSFKSKKLRRWMMDVEEEIS